MFLKALSKYNIAFIIVVSYVEFFLLFVCLLLYPFLFLLNNSIKNDISNIIKNYCLSSISYLSKIFLCTSFYVNDLDLYTEIIKNRNCIIIQNHLTELDSFVFFNTVNSICDNFNLKTSIVLREKTKLLVPSYGFLSLFGNDIYLEKNFENDKNVLSKNTKSDIMYMFPEGTCFTQVNKKKSDDYVLNNNLFKYKYVLYPRTRGLYNILKANPHINYIYDFTVCFDTIKKQDFGKKFIIANYFERHFVPRHLFIQIKKYSIIDENLSSEKKTENFLKKVYVFKDKFIKEFDPDINCFIPIKYNYLNGFLSFLFIFIMGIISFNLFFNYKIIRYFYLIELIIYFGYYFIKQIDNFKIK